MEYLIGYKNTGNTVQSNVVIRDVLPKNVTFVDGSAKLTNAGNQNGMQIDGNSLVTKGIGIGSYDTGANAYVQFRAKVTADGKALNCGKNTLRNYGHATADGVTKQDYADVTVDVECKPNECKPGIPVGDKRCENCPIPGKEHLPKDSPDCKENPPVEEKCPVPGKEHLPADSEDCEEDEAPTPTELPETGMGENILSLLGVGSLTGVTSAYIASRRK